MRLVIILTTLAIPQTQLTCPGYFKLCVFILRESGREDPLYTCSICVVMHAQTCDMQQRLTPAQELLSRIAKNFRERKLT